ncbi:MAG: GIY-YIG nuclease family protein [Chloroflexi bacterium]|nr:GIY-YIG nuclease family protein [Chloroflexota bacterium]
MENRGWFVYLLECADGTTYIGATRDVDRRVREHNDGVGARYTRGRRPVRLLGSIQCGTQGDALRQERRLKTLGPQGRRQAFNVR